MVCPQNTKSKTKCKQKCSSTGGISTCAKCRCACQRSCNPNAVKPIQRKTIEKKKPEKKKFFDDNKENLNKSEPDDETNDRVQRSRRSSVKAKCYKDPKIDFRTGT
eukprot:Pgem_evm1s12286